MVEKEPPRETTHREDPLLRHEVLAFYLRYKLKNRELFDPASTLKSPEED